ncbi:Uncharacterized protein dnl_33640 [Desulfonema limicola]|uniref:Uncharacterized protein n=1 Tax=Desulfonema limicola TaxID=45656 RepID=A0A975B929_9BACT|nr:Uncharacterized protein dnl_33640 [Desulfonema limicola]
MPKTDFRFRLNFLMNCSMLLKGKIFAESAHADCEYDNF